MASLLIIDDDEDIPEVLAEVLRDEGHEVRVAHDGAEGLKRIGERMPDLVILDVEMPVLSGPETAYLMLIHDCGQELIPVILVSGIVGLGRIAERIGTPYFLAKPYGLDEVIDLVNRALRERIPPHQGAQV